MKTKKLEKKLVLNKQTIGKLNEENLDDIRGGGPTIQHTICVSNCVTIACCL